jgi:ElaB/YqjD/DUF883 family membrane-anchored ribosome-binding protein
MEPEGRKTEFEKTAERAATAAQDVTRRVVSGAAGQAGDLAKHVQRVATDTDRQLEEYTGKSSAAWMNDASRLIKKHPWKAVALTAAVVYVLGKLRA